MELQINDAGYAHCFTSYNLHARFDSRTAQRENFFSSYSSTFLLYTNEWYRSIWKWICRNIHPKIHGIETLLLFSFRGWCAGSRVRLLDTKMRLKIDTVLEILFHDNDLAAVCQVLVPVFTFLWELSQCRRQGFYPLFQEVEVLVLLTEWCFDCHVLAFQILLSLAWAMLIFYTPRGGCGWRSSGLAACQEHGAICGKSKGFWMPQAERGIGSYIATAKGSDAREKLDLGHYYHHSSGVFLFSVLLIMGCFI